MFLLFSPAGAAWAELPSLRGQWKEMRTPHFVLLGDASERQMRKAGDSLESLSAFLDQTSGSNIEAPVPTYIFVFKDQRSFNPYRILQPNGEPLDVTGFFSQRQHANYIAVDASQRDGLAGITQHEYLHFFASYRMRGIPAWLDEGLAEFYSTFEVVGDHVNIGKIIPRHLKWLQQNSLIPLLDLFAVSHDSPDYNESDRRGVFYAQSWALVHYLLLELEDGRGRLNRFEQLRHKMSLPQAFEEAFGTSPDQMQRKLRKYVRSSRFTYGEAESSIDDLRKTFVFRDMNDSEALARLGELLASQEGRGEEAREHLQAALTLDAKEARAFVGLGLVEMLPSGDVGAAVDHFTAARLLAPDDRWIIFLQAQARSRRGDPGTSLRQDLVRVVNANPRYLDAWRLLAWAWSGETENIEEALRIFQGAHHMMPEEQSYAENLLYYYDRAGREEEAEKLIASYFRPQGLDPRRAFLVYEDPGASALMSKNAADNASVQSEVRESSSSGFGNVTLIEQAIELMAEQKYPEALEIYEKLVSDSPNIASLRSRRDELKVAVSHNRFIESYNKAVKLFGEHEWRKTAEELDLLLATEMSAENRGKAEKLLAQANKQWRLRGSSGL